MLITRNSHLRYMTKITPLLVLLYIAQIWLYRHFAPAHLGNDFIFFLGVGLVAIIGCFHFHDQHHKVICHPNYLEIRFDLLGIQEEVLYSEIVSVKIKQKNKNFGSLTITDRNDRVYHLYNIDNPIHLASLMAAKRQKLA